MASSLSSELLLLVASPPATRRVGLDFDAELVVGRGADCDLVLDDPRVSSRHSRLLRGPRGLRIEDLGSGNGTWVNGQPVDEAPLGAGDRIRVGGCLLLLCDGRAPSFEAAVAATEDPIAGHLDPAASLGEGTIIQEVPRASRLFDAVVALLSPPAEVEEDPAPLRRVLDGLVAAFQADRGAVFTLRPDGGVTTLAVTGDAAEDLPVSRRLLERVEAEGRALLLGPEQTAALREDLASVAPGLRSVVAAPVPLGRGGGVLYLDATARGRRFQEGDRELLATFSRAVGEALARQAATRRAERGAARMAEVQRRVQAGQEMLGESPAMQRVQREIAKVAATEVSALIQGESGTGKELTARALHRLSPRAEGPFVPVNCAAIPRDLLESEFFGHERGAFSGAAETRMGLLELASGGTLFLDEVGELPLELQAKLLRALQEREVRRVGGATSLPVDFRLVCATNRDLRAEATAGRFREDLYYRIDGYPIVLPPLRERGEDVILLARRYLRVFARQVGSPDLSLTHPAEQALRDQPWPGNVRELQNVVRQASIRAEAEGIGVADLFPHLAPAPDPGAAPPDDGGAPAGDARELPELSEPRFDAARKLFEARYLERRIRDHGGNMKATAEAIGLSRKALYRKCEEYGVDFRALR